MSKPTALKTAIFNSGRRQFAIGRDAGIKEPRMSKLANGYEDATPDEQKALARVLRKSRAELFPLRDEALGHEAR